jgi:hypothetical protein
MNKNLKTIDVTKKTFQANGHNYTILEGVPLSRNIMYEKLVARLTYGVDFHTLFQNIKQCYELQNSGKRYADVCVMLHNIMSGIKDVAMEERGDPAMQICTLIIVRDDEDLGAYDPALAKEKISDWAKEGYEQDGFFQCALISVRGFRKTFQEFMNLQAENKNQSNEN